MIQQANTSAVATGNEFSHELRFESLHNPGRGIVVPCDATGSVDLDHMSERLRNSYLGARARIGRDFAYPVVQQVH